jgi:hypothetical protein
MNRTRLPNLKPKLLERLSFASFLLSILFGLLLPVYTDEVGWRMQLRAGIDGGVDRMLSDICGPNTTATPPLFMMPLRLITGWVDTSFPDPLFVRLLGVACAIGWAFLMRALIGRIANDQHQRYLLGTLTFALLGMGVLPIMLVMSRPDQAVLLSITAALFVTVVAGQRADNIKWRAWLWPFLIAAFGLVAVAFHLKGILFVPLVLVCIYFADKRHKAPRIAAALLFTILAAQGAHYWFERFRCPNDPVLAEKLGKQNIASALATEGDWRTLTMSALMGANPNNYIMLAEAHKFPMSDWLPRGQIKGGTSMIRFVAMALAWNGVTLIALICLIRALRLRWREGRIDLSAAVPVALAGTAMIWGMSQRVRNDYEIMIVLPMLALFCVFSLAAIRWTPQRTKQLGLGAAIIALLSLMGQADIAWRYYPSLRSAAADVGYIDKQPFSVSAFGYSSLRDKILETARLCHIGTAGRAQHPLVDDLTYFALADSWQPFHRFGVLESWNGSITDPLAYLKAKGSEGIIMGCRNLSPALRQQAIRNGEFCCISTR